MVLVFACTEGSVPLPSLGKDRPTGKLVVPRGTYHPDKAEAEVVGAINARINRRSPYFQRLVRVESEAIVFKDEEGTGADRLMTTRTRERLERLSSLVLREWPGVRLRVTEAWDENAEHGAKSVHYEGRALDLTTSDQDSSRLGRLAGMAIEAGFDWVIHESTHVHASVAR